MDLLKTIGKYSKLIPLALSGPVGVASTIATVVRDVFGVESNDDAELARAIERDPQAALKLRQIELDHRTELQRLAFQTASAHLAAETARIESVNQTMRVEAQSEKWPQYSWRPFWGFISALAFLMVCVFVGIIAFEALKNKDPAAIAMVPQLVTSFATLFTIPGAILGITAWHRGRQKRVAAGEAPRAGLMARVAKAVGQ
jgi:hypothetical protein